MWDFTIKKGIVGTKGETKYIFQDLKCGSIFTRCTPQVLTNLLIKLDGGMYASLGDGECFHVVHVGSVKIGDAVFPVYNAEISWDREEQGEEDEAG